MTWRVVVTRDAAITDGAGEHQRTRTVRVLAYPPVACDTRDEAERKAQHIRNANRADPTVDVAVEAPEAQLSPTTAVDRQAAAAGIARARAALRGEP